MYLILVKSDRMNATFFPHKGTDESAQVKAQELYNVNKGWFKYLEITVFKGEYLPGIIKKG